MRRGPALVLVAFLAACGVSRRVEIARAGRECRLACQPPCDQMAEDAGEWAGPPADQHYQNYCARQMHAREHCLNECERLFPWEDI